MDIYKNIYNQLVDSRRVLKEKWEPGSALERHRIIPAHQGGKYEDANCTYLTHREHIIAHYLLWKLHGNPGDKRAYQMMRGNVSPFTSHSEYTRRHMSESHVGVSLSEEHRKRISEGQRGRVPGFVGKSHSEETKQLMSEKQRGRIITDEHRKKISEARKSSNSSWVTDEYRNKMSESKLGTKHSEETKQKMKDAWAKRKAAKAAL